MIIPKYTKSRELVDQLSNYKFLKEDSVSSYARNN
jgi:hypothetical protein